MNRRYVLYYAAAIYLLYLVYGFAADIKNGESENILVSVIAAVFFALAAGAIALYAWRKSKAEQAEAEQAEAERTEPSGTESDLDGKGFARENQEEENQEEIDAETSAASNGEADAESSGARLPSSQVRSE